MEIFKIENLTFKYPSSDNFALKDVSLSIKKGEFHTICGQSGCGKTTLLRLLKPSLSPNGEKSGRIFFENLPVENLSDRENCEKIGFVMQNPDNQIVTDKVWHELAFGLESMGMRNSEIRTRVSEMAAFFGIEDWYHKKVTELSGGQKQLLNLASVMVMQPSVIILDEPTSQLDPISAREFLEMLAKINREIGVSVILSEHRLEDALSLSDHVTVMDNGKILFTDTPYMTANNLKKVNHPMLCAMPAAMRICAAVENKEETPVTVREGRGWLIDYSMKNTLRKIEIQENEKNENEYALSVDNVFFRYEKDGADVIRGLSAKIHKGEFYAILGGNGSGKTTMLSLINGINKPYRGNIRLLNENLKMGTLPQNPQSLFTQKTVEKDMWEMLSDKKIPREEKEKLINESMYLCETEHLKDRHPYDLSGGEMQKCALCKILLLRPDILLLDEPTKGLDAQFKEKMAQILLSLKNSGVTVIMVSHDVEFCCQYADRCAMFFDGCIISCDTPRKFFSDKTFFTTAANRISRGIIENAVSVSDVVFACCGKEIREKTEIKKNNLYEKREETKKCVKQKKSPFRILIGIIFLLAAILTIIIFNNKYTDWRMYLQHALTYVFLFAAFNFLLPQKELGGTYAVQKPAGKRKNTKSTVLSIIVLLIIVPMTIFIGNVYLGDRKYYFISLLIIFEIMVPFVFSFENRKPQTREIVVLSVLCAITVLGRVAFYMLPQFKPMAAIIIITGVCFGAETGFLCGSLSMFASNFFFSQGPWTPWQMFGFGIIGFLSGFLFQKGLLRKNIGELCLFGFLSVIICYGGLLNPASVIMYTKPTWKLIKESFVLGLALDIIHGVSTAFFLYVCAPEMIEKLERIKQKYGITIGF